MCTKAVKEGKEVAFVVAGKEDFNKVLIMEPGWGSLSAISKQLDDFIELDDIEKQAEEIKKAMAEEPVSETKKTAAEEKAGKAKETAQEEQATETKEQ